MKRIEDTFSELSYFDKEDMQNIELKARSLTLDECLDFLGANADDIDEAEMAIAQRIHRKGRAAGIALACDHMFSSMKSKQGGAVAMEYLKQLSGTFKADVEQQLGNGNGFSFNVVMSDK